METSSDDENCIENQEENYSDASFVTSTPRKTVFQCEECDFNSQCIDCFARQTVETGNIPNYRKRKVHFMSHTGETC